MAARWRRLNRRPQRRLSVERFLSKRQIAPLIVEGVTSGQVLSNQSIWRIEIAATWSGLHLADDEYAARLCALWHSDSPLST